MGRFLASGLGVLVALVSVASSSDSGSASGGHGYKSSRSWLPREPVVGAVSAEVLVAEEQLPKFFDWRDVGGKSLVTTDWNQHIPQYCGACWIHGTVSALNDRIKVMRGGKFPDIMLGRQAIINCVPDPSGKGSPPGCDGGDSWMIHKFLHEHKVPDESCMPYQARNMACTPENICRNCLPGGKCFTVKNWIGYGVSSYGNVSGETAMMKEIYARGPIACSFATDAAFMVNFSANALQHEGVYVTDQKFNESQIDHVMEVAGWGETPSGLKYWVVRNSWGTYWGSAGWLKFRRGHNQMLSEEFCDWAVPSFEDLDTVLQGRAMGSYIHGLIAVTINATTEQQWSDSPEPAVVPLTDGKSKGDEVRSGIPTLTFVVIGAFLMGITVPWLAARFVVPGRFHRQPPLLG